jgi:hypothetical protein
MRKNKMHETPKKTYEEILRERPFCERQALLHDHICSGRSTMEHAWIYAGKQIPDKWAIIRSCWWAHLGSGLNKRINEWISLRHATEADLKKYPNKNWEQIRKHLNNLYGK